MLLVFKTTVQLSTLFKIYLKMGIPIVLAFERQPGGSELKTILNYKWKLRWLAVHLLRNELEACLCHMRPCLKEIKKKGRKKEER